MKSKIWIPFQLPGMNEIINSAKIKKGKWSAYNTWKHQIESQIHLFLKDVPVFKSVFIKITWVERNKRRDPDNISAGKKFICDSLVKEGIIKNDGWAEVDGFSETFSVSKENPGVLVELSGELL